MPVDDIMELLLFVVLVVLPLLTVTLRLSLKPIVEAVLQLSDGLSRPGRSRIEGGEAEAVDRMQDELAELRRKVADLEAAQTFYRGLIEPPEPSDPPAPES